jgi:hypothetical protein
MKSPQVLYARLVYSPVGGEFSGRVPNWRWPTRTGKGLCVVLLLLAVLLILEWCAVTWVVERIPAWSGTPLPTCRP